MDDQLLDVLAADTDSGSVGFSVLFLSWVNYRQIMQKH